jgi:hypothetical protein
LVHFVFIWYIFSGFGIMYQEKSGNPGLRTVEGSIPTSEFNPEIWTRFKNSFQSVVCSKLWSLLFLYIQLLTANKQGGKSKSIFRIV